VAVTFRVRYRLSVAGGLAMQEVDGRYVALEDVEAEMGALRADAERDYEGMRKFQADFIHCDHHLRYLRDLMGQLLEHPDSEGLKAKARQLCRLTT